MPRSMFVLVLAVLALGAVGCQGESNPGGPRIAVSTTTGPTSTGPTGAAPRIVLSKSGACGEAYFWASNPEGTAAVTVTVDVRPRSTSKATSVTFTVPDPKVKIEIQRGRNLLQTFCSDVIGPDSRVDTREIATHGTGRIVVAPPLVSGRCGAKGDLHLDGLVTDAGTRFAAIDVKTKSIGCYAG